MAECLKGNLHQWFRNKYNLPPTDPRFLLMTDEEIALEYELDLVHRGEALKRCPRCKTTTHQKTCPNCQLKDGNPMELTGDELADEIKAKMAEGEELDLDAIFNPNRPETFEPIPRG
jgi:hypothetical protein